MFRIAQRTTLHLWIALLAVLFSALAPSISHALAANSPNSPNSAYSIGAICSSDPGSKAPAGSMADCAYCLSPASHPALLPAAPAQCAVLDGHDAYPPLPASSSPRQPQHETAQARGPPAHS